MNKEVLDTYFKLMTMNGGAYVFNTVSKLQLLNPFFKGDSLSSEEIASDKGLNPNTLTLLYDVLCSLNLLEKNNGKYKLAPVFMMLNDNYQSLSSQYWEHLPKFIMEDIPFRRMDQVEESEEVYRNEVRSLGYMMEPSALNLVKEIGSQYKNIIDIGAGSGVWCNFFLKENKNSNATLVDWPAVLNVAKERARNTNLEKRVEYIEGNYHQVDFGSGYDLAILGNVAHLENDENLDSLIKKSYNSLKEDGSILIVDCFGENKEGEVARSLYKLGLSLRTVDGRVPEKSWMIENLKNNQFKSQKFISLDVHPFTMGAILASKN